MPPCEAIATFKQELSESSFSEPRGILFRGEGGVGKTWLYEYLYEYISEEIAKCDAEAKSGYPKNGYVLCSIKLDREETDASSWFADIRNDTIRNIGHSPALVERRMEFVRTDCLMRLYSKYLGDEGFLSPKLKFFKKVPKVAGVVTDTVFGAMLGVLGAVARPVASSVANIVLDHDLVKLAREDIAGHERWHRDEFEERFPSFLARDLNDIQGRSGSYKLVLLIDGYDRMLASRDAEKTRVFESRLRAFIKEIKGGLVCVFSQYDVPWFVGGIPEDEEECAAPFIISDIDDEVTDISPSNISFDDESEEVPNVGTGHSIDPLKRRSREFKLSPFDPAMTRQFLMTRGFEGIVDNPCCATIINTTSLPFEIEEKCAYLRTKMSDIPERTKEIAESLSLPFGEFFSHAMDAKPSDEANILSLIWRLDLFTKSTIAEIAKLSGLREEGLADRVLRHGIIESGDRFGRSADVFRVDPHFLLHLQAHYLTHRMEQRFRRQKPKLTPSSILLGLREQRGSGRALTPALWNYYGEGAAVQYCREAAIMAAALIDCRSAGADVKEASIRESAAENAFRLLRDSTVDVPNGGTGTGKSPRLLGSWSAELIDSVFDAVFDDLARVTSRRTASFVVKTLADVEKYATVFLVRGDISDAYFPQILSAGPRALEARGVGAERWRGSDDAIALKTSFVKWIESIKVLIDKKSTIHASVTRYLDYWKSRLTCHFYAFQPVMRSHLDATARNARAFQFGSSKGKFLGALDRLESVLQGGVDAQFLESRQHRHAMLWLHLRRMQIENSNSRIGFVRDLNMRYGEAKTLYEAYPSDYELLAKFIYYRLEQYKGWRHSDEIKEYYETSKKLHRDFGGNIDLLYSVEKAGVLLARMILTESMADRPVSGAADSKGIRPKKGFAARKPQVEMPKSARDVLSEVHSILLSEVKSVDVPPLELSKLFAKHLRKSGEEGFVVPIDEFLSSYLTTLLEHVAARPDHTSLGIVAELTRYARVAGEAGADLRRMIETAFSLVAIGQTEDPRAFALRRAIWAKLIAESLPMKTEGGSGSPEATTPPDTMAALGRALDLIEVVENDPPCSLEEINRHKLPVAQRLLDGLCGQVRAGVAVWSELSSLLERCSRIDAQKRLSLVRKTVSTLKSVDRSVVDVGFLAELENLVFALSPLDLTLFAPLAQLRNEVDASMDAALRSRRDVIIEDILALSAEEDGDEEAGVDGAPVENGLDAKAIREARLAAVSALAQRDLVPLLDRVGTDAFDRLLLEAIIASDPVLPREDSLRERMRRLYAEGLLRRLHDGYDFNRNERTTYIAWSGPELEEFASGDHADFVRDLTSLIAAFPKRRPLVGRDLIAMALQRLTYASVDNGAKAEPGPISFNREGDFLYTLQSNFASARRYHDLCAAHEAALAARVAPEPLGEAGAASAGQEGAVKDAEKDEGVVVTWGEAATDQPTVPQEKQTEEWGAPHIVDAETALKGGGIRLENPLQRVLAVRKVVAGTVMTSERGQEYVVSLLDILYPGLLHRSNTRVRFALGASNSYLGLFVPADVKTRLLKLGWFNSTIEQLAGLKRVAFLACADADGPAAVEAELRELASVGFQDLDLTEYNGEFVRFVGNEGALQDERKVRTFKSIAEKLFPDLRIVISPVEWWRQQAEQSASESGRLNFDDDDASVVDQSADFGNLRRLEVSRIIFDRSTGRPRTIFLTDADGNNFAMPPDLTARFSCYFTVGLEFDCRLRRGRRGEPEILEAKLQFPPPEAFVDAVILQRDGQRALLELDESSGFESGTTATCSAGHLAFAGYGRARAGEVLKCVVKEIEGKWRAVYIQRRDGATLTPRQLTARVVNFSKVNFTFLLSEDESEVRRPDADVPILLSLEMVHRYGYASLWPGDRVIVQVLADQGRRWVCRFVGCSRALVTGIDAIVQRTKGGLKLLVRDVARIAPNGRPMTIPFNGNEAALAPGGVVPNGAKVIVDLQEGRPGTWMCAQRIRLDLLNAGEWGAGMLTQFRAGRTDSKLLTFFRPVAGGQQGLVPPVLLQELPSSHHGLWVEAKLCQTVVNGERRTAVCALRRASKPARSRVPGVIGRFSNDAGVFEVQIEGGEGPALLSPITLDRAGLPKEAVNGMPVACWLETLGTRTWVADLMFDDSKGWTERLCHLGAIDHRRQKFTLVDHVTGAAIGVGRTAMFIDILDGAPLGTVYRSTGYVYPHNVPRLVDLRMSPADTPWIYGRIHLRGNDGVTIQTFDQSDIHVSWSEWRRRRFAEVKLRGFVRFTLLPGEDGDSLGLLEHQDDAEPWAFFGYVNWVDWDMNRGNIKLVDLPDVSVQMRPKALDPDDTLGLLKGLPLHVTMQSIIRDGKNSDFQCSATALSGVIIAKLPWWPAVITHLHPGGAAFCEVMDDDDNASTAYICAELVDTVAEAGVAVGDRLLCQSLPGLYNRRNVVNFVPLLDVQIDASVKVAICEKYDANRRTARFSIIGLNREAMIRGEAFMGEDDEEIRLRVGDIFLVQIEFAGDGIWVTDILERLGRRVGKTPISLDV